MSPQAIQDKLFALEYYIESLINSGKTADKTLKRFFQLSGQLKTIKAKMVLLEDAI